MMIVELQSERLGPARCLAVGAQFGCESKVRKRFIMFYFQAELIAVNPVWITGQDGVNQR